MQFLHENSRILNGKTKVWELIRGILIRICTNHLLNRIVIEIEKENNIKNRDKRKQNDSSEGSIDIDNDKIEKG